MSAQTKEVFGFSLALRQLQEDTQAKAQIEGGWPLSWKGWPRVMRTSDSGWFSIKRTNAPGWLSRWTTPSGRSSLSWVRLIQWGFFPSSFLLLPSLVWVPHAHWVMCSLPSYNLGWIPQWAPLPQHPLATQYVELLLHLQLSLYQIFLPPAFQLGSHSLHSPQSHVQEVGFLPCSIPEGHSGKIAGAGTKEGSISSGCSTPPIQLVAIHSPKCLEPGLINLPSSPVKDLADPSDRLAVEASGSIIDHDRDSTVEVGGNNAGQSGNESDLSSDLQESAADSGPNSATGDYLMCQEVAVNSTHKKFWKIWWVSCSITKGCLWSETQLRLTGDSHQAVWGSDYEFIWAEWEHTLKEGHNSF